MGDGVIFLVIEFGSEISFTQGGVCFLESGFDGGGRLGLPILVVAFDPSVVELVLTQGGGGVGLSRDTGLVVGGVGLAGGGFDSTVGLALGWVSLVRDDTGLEARGTVGFV